MGLIQRLLTLSLGSKPIKKKQNKKKLERPILPSCQSTNNLLTTTYPSQDQAAVNRLLRSSSTHFSVLSETEYHSLPPIPHPINNLLREPSIISTQTTNTVNTYTVTIHQRTVHSRTEFPNANGATSLLSTPSNSPQKNSHPIPPFTPGDKTRLETLRGDPSVLSLLNIFDDFGHPNPKAFANTPVRQRRVSTFKMLLGEQEEPVEETSMELAKESDLSWAERCLQKAQRGSSDSLSHISSLGMADDLFRDDLSDIRGADDQLNMSMTSQSSIVDSLEVELGTAENGTVVICSPKSVLKEEDLLQFLLQDDKDSEEETAPPPVIPQKLSTALQIVPQPPRGPRAMGESEPKPRPRFTVRDGPQMKQTQLSPPPRKQQPPPLPLIPPDFQFKSIRLPKVNPLGYRAPFEGLRNNGGLSASIIPSGMTNRSVSVASSVYPQIETMPPLPPMPPLPSENDIDTDPYTPIPRRSMEERRGHQDVFASDQNVPPGAPLRPTKSQIRKFSQGPHKCRRKKFEAGRQFPKQTASQPAKPEHNESDKENDENFAHNTPKKSLIATLKVPEQPSPASSSDLSPHGRRMMDAVRAQMRTSRATPRKWNPLVDNLNTITAVMS